MTKLERLARRIIRAVKHHSAHDMKEDEREYPDSFAKELKWLMKTLEKNGVKNERE